VQAITAEIEEVLLPFGAPSSGVTAPAIVAASQRKGIEALVGGRVRAGRVAPMFGNRTDRRCWPSVSNSAVEGRPQWRVDGSFS